MNNKLKGAFVTLATVAVISSGMITSAAATQVAAPAPSGSVVHVLKNRNCGWSITTRYHSCDLAYSLVLKWVNQADYPSSMEDVFSPNSGMRYDVKCSGVKTVTCKSNKGSVTFKPAKVPQQYKCLPFKPGEWDAWGYAWLNGSCELAIAVIQAYSAAASAPSALTVQDPTDGKILNLVCAEVEEYSLPRMCLAGKKAVLIDY